MSLFNFGYEPTHRNIRSVKISEYNPDPDALQDPDLDAIMHDIGLDRIVNDNNLLINALSDPTNFIKSKDSIQIQAVQTILSTSKEIYDIIKHNNNLPDFPEDILNDIMRTLTRDIAADLINEIDKMTRNVNHLVLNKISKTPIPSTE